MFSAEVVRSVSALMSHRLFRVVFMVREGSESERLGSRGCGRGSRPSGVEADRLHDVRSGSGSGSNAAWLGQLQDCTCADSWAHGRDRDLGDEAQCPATIRRRGEDLLAQLRVWMVEQAENGALVGECEADPLVEINAQVAVLNRLLTGVGSDRSEVAGLDGDALMGAVLGLEDTQRRLDAVKASVLGVLVSSGVTESEAGLGAKRWKAYRTHGSDATVARELRVSRTLARFEHFADALARGAVGVDHVLALAAVCNDRTVDGLVELQDSLVRFAKLQSYKVFVAHLRRVVAVVDPDGSEPDCGDRDTASLGRDLEGHLHVRLEASGHNAVEVEQIINAETDRQFRSAVKEYDATGMGVPAHSVLRARAIVELIRRGAQPNPKASSPVVEAVLPVTVDVHGNVVGIHTVDGYDLDTITAATLICDAHTQPVVVDSAGNPLNMGRLCRFFTAEQRKAMVLRDGGCIFPGCDQPASRCDAHHGLEWVNGGLTDICNGGFLCRRHHGLVHCHDPWVIEHFCIEDLPADLREAHRVRAASGGMDPSVDVVVVRSPKGKRFLAQNAVDHRGPAPPQRPPAA